MWLLLITHKRWCNLDDYFLFCCLFVKKERQVNWWWIFCPLRNDGWMHICVQALILIYPEQVFLPREWLRCGGATWAAVYCICDISFSHNTPFHTSHLDLFQAMWWQSSIIYHHWMSKAMSASPACYSSSDLAYARYNEEVSRNINNAANQVGDGKHIGVTHINKNSNPAHHFLKRERFDIAVNDTCTCMCWFVLMTIHLPRSFYHLTPLWMVVHLHIKGGVPAKQKKESKRLCTSVSVRACYDRSWGEKERESQWTRQGSL